MASAVQRLRAIHLYRHSLKNMLSWAVRREVFYAEVRRPRPFAPGCFPHSLQIFVAIVPTKWLACALERSLKTVATV